MRLSKKIFYFIVPCGLVITVLETRFGATAPYPGSGSWLDKIPSVEVKFKSDGVSVSTGPSREEIYWMIGYIIIGVVVSASLLFCICFCAYKCCFQRMISGSTIVVTDGIPISRDVPMFQQGSFHYHRPTRSAHYGAGPNATKFDRAKRIFNPGSDQLPARGCSAQPPPYRSNN